METIPCPKCGVTHAATTLTPPPYGEAVKALLKAWRLWVAAFGITIVLGMISGGLNVGQAYVGAISGALIGFTCWTLMTRLRRCPACNATFSVSGSAKKPG